MYRKLWELEHKAYLRAHAWKKSYSYTLIDEYRQHITFAKNAYITGYEMLMRYKEEKAQCYKASIGELSIVESNMDHMMANDIGIMSEKEWAEKLLK